MTVHPLFPILYKDLFMVQYSLLYQSQDPSTMVRKWLAIINLVFAIGERNLSMAGLKASEDWQNLTFFLRARILGALDGGVVFEIPTLQDVQSMGLAGMYLLGSKQTNRYASYLVASRLLFRQLSNFTKGC
jgi:hypothetical protein